MPFQPDAELTARFRRDVEALTGEAPAPGKRLGLAVSGGPDSMALLLLAAAAYPGAVAAATVDHGLRREAAEEAATVAAACARLDVPHAVLRLDRPAEGNLQQWARDARYAALADWAEGRAAWVAVAHQRDDVAETFLARARRGSGAAGLAAMRRSRPLGSAALIRPLLDWSRAELAGVATAAEVTCADDRSNADPRFDRSRLRALLAATPELPPSRLARAAHNLRHADDALEWMAAALGPRLSEEGEGLWLDAAGLPYELCRRLARQAVTRVRESSGLSRDWRDSGLDRLLAALERGASGTIAGVQARAIRGRWHFRPAPPRRSH